MTTTTDRPVAAGVTFVPKPCPTCEAYLVRRAPVVGPVIATEALARFTSPLAAMAAFVRGLHARHLAGHSLDR